MVTHLNDIVEQLERNWDVVVDPNAYQGGSEAYVAAATTSDSAEAVIKIAIPGNALTTEARTLALANGHGYARLLEHDDVRQAMLLERLGTSLADLGLPIKTQIEILCGTFGELGKSELTQTSRLEQRRPAASPLSSRRSGRS